MEPSLPISFLNDFIFCPKSIYFHQLYGRVETSLYQNTDQISGKGAHATVDAKKYSSKKSILQGVEVYSEKYNLQGKIDVYDEENKILRERKKEIKVIYDGYIFQVYAQYFCLVEMGFEVLEIQLYDITHNKVHKINKPEEDEVMFQKFLKLLEDIKNFDLETSSFVQNENKCRRCIYNNICDSSLC
ncbi:MAG: type V CRISPR-associated protein Cas4 [Leptospiraceae bacterium]|nr:type V CRISPR-associated protein Cas4 [Leptospiraceae bacterium]